MPVSEEIFLKHKAKGRDLVNKIQKKLSRNNLLISESYLQKFTEEQKTGMLIAKGINCDLLVPFLHKPSHVSWIPM